MKPIFKISRLGAHKESPKIDTIITNDDFDCIAKKLTGKNEYKVNWLEEKIRGKMFTLETKNDLYFITFTPKRVDGRNSYLQSVPTAFSEYLRSSKTQKKQCHFCLYFTPFTGENQTRYHQLIYRLLLSMGVNFINPETGIKGLKISAYKNTKELIEDRDSNRDRNSSNQSSYITNEGSSFHIYGKTFGANQKETTMICLAMCRISDKPIKLFQISDNNSEYLSETDIEAIKYFVEKNGQTSIEILDDTYEFDEDNAQAPIATDPGESLRSPKFIYNLLANTGGHKKCVLCDCTIESIVQGAHIYPVAAIKQQSDLSLEEKLSMATDKNNGLWLCENHHKLFDRGLIKFDKGMLNIMPKLNDDEKNYVNTISTCQSIDNNLYTDDMKSYFQLRDEFYRSEKIY